MFRPKSIMGMALIGAGVLLLNTCNEGSERCSEVDITCRRTAKAKLSVITPGTIAGLNQEIVLDALDSTFDDIRWYLNDHPIPECNHRGTCNLTIPDDGNHTVKIKVKVDASGQATFGLIGTAESEDTTDVTISVLNYDAPDVLCPNREPTGATPIVNGCTNSPDNPNLNNKCLNILDSRNFPSFKSACDDHDRCYDTCNSVKTECDFQFERDLYAICDTVPDGDCREQCQLNATAYAESVLRFGSDPYIDAQKRVCACQ